MMIKTVILGRPNLNAQRCIDRLHRSFLESCMVDEPAWAKPYFNEHRDRAFDQERADRLMHGQCMGEGPNL